MVYVVKATPYVPAVGTDMACPAIGSGPPDVIGMAADGQPISCFAVPSAAQFPVGSPNSRSISLATAYQCTDPTKPCIVTINIQSTAAISLSGGQTNTGNALIGTTTGVATGTGTILCVHGNSNTGTLTIGLNLSTIATTQCTLPVPIGQYFAVRQISGTITILSAFDQSMG